MNALVIFLANAAFFYPVYWASMFLLRACPALLHVVLLRHRLLSFEFGPLWVEATCCPPGAFAAHERSLGPGALESIILAVAASLVFFALRKRRALSGLFIAALGQIALTGPLLGWLFGRLHNAAILAALCVYAAIVLVGLMLLSTSVHAGYWKRFAAAATGFCLPLAAFSSFYVWLGEDWRIIPILAGPALLLALVAPLWNRPAASNPNISRSTLLRRLALGLTASLLLAAALHAGELLRYRSREASRKALMATLPKPSPNSGYPRVFFQKGVNFTAEGPVGYDAQSALPLLEQLRTYGVDSIALVPYGFARSKEPVIHYPGGMERSEDIEALAALAHQRGMKILLKPQLWTGGGFPGGLDFPEPRQRAQWFAAYRKFLEYYATLASRIHADVFSVGVELAKMTPFETEWRALIARAREIYPGPLVYSATQGPEFETIRFWDALDYIGLNEYYPLPDDLSTADLVRTVERVQAKFARPVIFTEAGFCSYARPNRAPWDETPRTLAPADQARCYGAVLKAFYAKPWFQGVYWWKVGTDGSGGPQDGSHTPWGKTAMDVVRRWYRNGDR